MEFKTKKPYNRRLADRISMISLPDLLKKATSLTDIHEEENNPA